MMYVELYDGDDVIIYTLDCEEDEKAFNKFKKVLTESLRDNNLLWDCPPMLDILTEKMGVTVSALDSDHLKFTIDYEDIQPEVEGWEDE